MPERNVLPKPYVKPHPPMWVAAGNPEHVREGRQARPRRPLLHRWLAGEDGAARRDLQGARSTTPSRSATTSTTTSPITTSFMCLEDGDAARRLDDPVAATAASRACVFKYLDTFPKPPGVPEWPTGDPGPDARADARRAPRRARRSSARPTSAPRRCEKWDAIGVDQLIMGPTGSTYPYELVEETVELFGNKVIPQLRHRPRRARAARFRREAGRAPRRRLSNAVSSRRPPRPVEAIEMATVMASITCFTASAAGTCSVASAIRRFATLPVAALRGHDLEHLTGPGQRQQGRGAGLERLVAHCRRSHPSQQRRVPGGVGDRVAGRPERRLVPAEPAVGDHAVDDLVPARVLDRRQAALQPLALVRVPRCRAPGRAAGGRGGSRCGGCARRRGRGGRPAPAR